MPNGHRDDDPHYIPEDPKPKPVMPIGAGVTIPAPEGTVLRIEIRLPQELVRVLAIMQAVAEEFPRAKTMPNGVDGWNIVVEAEV